MKELKGNSFNRVTAVLEVGRKITEPNFGSEERIPRTGDD